MTAADPRTGLEPGGIPASPAGARAPGSLTTRELREHLVETRARLAGTLDALEDKANLLKHYEKISRAAAARLKQMKPENRLGFVVVAFGGVIVAGLIATAVVKTMRKR